MANWGITTALGSTNTINHCRAMGGTFNGGTGQELTSISMYLGGSGNVRLGSYTGGSLSTGPAGATLIWDGGVVATSGSGWYTATHPGPYPGLTNGSIVWTAWKANDATALFFFSASSGDAGDYQTANGRWASASMSTDETVAFPSTWPSDAGSFSSFWVSNYISYQAASGGISIPVVINHLRNQGIS